MQNLIIEGEEFHHIVNVFRKKPQDRLLLSNGHGLKATAVLDKIGKKSITLQIIESRPTEKSSPRIAVGFSLLRNKNDHLIVEKLTELGVSEFFPFISSYTVRNSSNNTIEKFKKTAIAALKQCDNPFLPQIREVMDLEKALSVLQQENFTVLTALERDAVKLLPDCLPEPLPPKIVLLFGPEGGFSDEEIAFLGEQSGEKFTLGNHVLRAETAAISGVSQLLLKILKQQPDYL
jgi:16S rRNA (uracil1498-N3)-methyltransferase